MAERSLSKLMQDQVKSQEETKNAIQSLNKTFVDYFKVLKRGKGDEEEARREKGFFSRMLGGGSSSSGATAADGSSGLLGGMVGGGGMFGGIFRSLLGRFSFILKPLKLIARLLRFGGPIAIVFGLMYAVFKDIGDNPQFQKILEQLKELWEKAKTGFTNLKVFITDLASKVDLEAAITGITNWLEKLRLNLQNFVATTLANALDIVNNIIDGIGKLFEGDFKAAFDNFKNIAKGLVNIVQSFVTSLLSTFGIDVEEEGLFARLWDGVKQEVKEKWNAITSTVSSFFTTIKDFFAETIPNTVVDVKNSISNKANELRDTVVNFVTDTWALIKSYIPNPVEIAQNLKDKVLAIAPDWLKEWLADNTETNSATMLRNERGYNPYQIEGGMDYAIQESRAKFKDVGQIISGVRGDATGALQVEAESYAKRYASTFGSQNINIGTFDQSTQNNVANSSGGKGSTGQFGSAIDQYYIEKLMMQQGVRPGHGPFGY